MNTESFEYMYKLLLLGDSGVGKSSLLMQYVDRIYEISYITTIGIDFKSKIISDIDNKNIKIHIYDTSGQERFKCITNTYYKGVNGIILMFDLCDKQTFDNLEYWYNEIKKHASDNVIIYIVGNKIDCKNRREINIKEATDFATKIDAVYMEITVKNIEMTEKLFKNITTDIFHKSNITQLSENKLNLENKIQEHYKCCIMQ